MKDKRNVGQILDEWNEDPKPFVEDLKDAAQKIYENTGFQQPSSMPMDEDHLKDLHLKAAASVIADLFTGKAEQAKNTINGAFSKMPDIGVSADDYKRIFVEAHRILQGLYKKLSVSMDLREDLDEAADPTKTVIDALDLVTEAIDRAGAKIRGVVAQGKAVPEISEANKLLAGWRKQLAALKVALRKAGQLREDLDEAAPQDESMNNIVDVIDSSLKKAKYRMWPAKGTGSVVTMDAMDTKDDNVFMIRVSKKKNSKSE